MNTFVSLAIWAGIFYWGWKDETIAVDQNGKRDSIYLRLVAVLLTGLLFASSYKWLASPILGYLADATLRPLNWIF